MDKHEHASRLYHKTTHDDDDNEHAVHELESFRETVSVRLPAVCTPSAIATSNERPMN